MYENKLSKFPEDLAWFRHTNNACLGRQYIIQQPGGGGQIQRFVVEPGIEIYIFHDCTYSVVSGKTPIQQSNIIEITSLVGGFGKVRCSEHNEWTFFNSQDRRVD